MNKPLVLCILDGCGVREETDGNAFKNANTPTLDMLFEKYPNSILEASGPAVGLPTGQMGTSEVGHMNLGSGRIALQPLEAITKSKYDNIKKGVYLYLQENPQYKKFRIDAISILLNPKLEIKHLKNI